MRHDTESGDAAGHNERADGQIVLTRRAPGPNSGVDGGQKRATDGQCTITTTTPEPESARAGQPNPTDGPGGATRPADLSTIVDDLAEQQVSRLRFIRTQVRIDNAATSLVRRMIGWTWDMPEAERARINKRAGAIISALYGDKPTNDPIGPLVVSDVSVYRAARTPVVDARAKVEKSMRKLAHRLHVWPWVQSVRGFGDLALAVIVAEAGDLADYPDVGRLWKRFGLTPYNGHAASTWRMRRKIEDEDGNKIKLRDLSKDEWDALGYKPARNAETFAVLGDPLFRQQTMIGGPYRAVYDREKARFLEAGCSKLHAHRHGLRCMRKAAIEDLWLVWNGREPKRRPGGGQSARTDDQPWLTPAGADAA